MTRRITTRRRQLVRAWPAPAVSTDGFGLRALRPEDRPQFLASIDGHTRRWLGYDERVLQRYERMFRFLAVWELVGALQVRRLVAERDGALAACYTLWPSGTSGRHVSLSWWVAPHARGRALGRASLRAVLQHVHAELDAPVARMGVHPDNTRAIRQIISVGAKPVGESDRTLPDGRIVPARWYHHRDR